LFGIGVTALFGVFVLSYWKSVKTAKELPRPALPFAKLVGESNACGRQSLIGLLEVRQELPPASSDVEPYAVPGRTIRLICRGFSPT
jgi:hypothetical protein